MQVTQRRRLPFGRGITLLAAVACALAVIALTGCLPDRAESNPQSNADQMSAKELAAAQKQAQANGATAGDGVMKYEDGAADPLAGDWLYTGMNYTPANKQWGKGKLWPDTELRTVTFVKQGEVYSLERDTVDTVTFDGQNVTIEGTSDNGFHSKYSGVLKGDAITGTRHHDVEKLVYDGPWSATRVK